MPAIPGSNDFVPSRGSLIRLWLAMAVFAAAVGTAALLRMAREACSTAMRRRA